MGWEIFFFGWWFLGYTDWLSYTDLFSDRFDRRSILSTKPTDNSDNDSDNDCRQWLPIISHQRYADRIEPYCSRPTERPNPYHRLTVGGGSRRLTFTRHQISWRYFRVITRCPDSRIPTYDRPARPNTVQPLWAIILSRTCRAAALGHCPANDMG